MGAQWLVLPPLPWEQALPQLASSQHFRSALTLVLPPVWLLVGRFARLSQAGATVRAVRQPALTVQRRPAPALIVQWQAVP